MTPCCSPDGATCGGTDMLEGVCGARYLLINSKNRKLLAQKKNTLLYL
jgi:hypothetical protein